MEGGWGLEEVVKMNLGMDLTPCVDCRLASNIECFNTLTSRAVN